MSLPTTIGHISLNISFITYLIVYLPQIIHNQKSKHIAQLSVIMHFILFLCYLFDLFYGFAGNFPWEYKTVSIVGLSLLAIQHIQLLKFFIAKQHRVLLKFNLIFLIFSLVGLYYFFIVQESKLNVHAMIICGILARSFGLIYCLPQISKNKTLKSTQAVSLYFIYLNIFSTLLDTISAWCLNWAWPSKLAPVTLFLMLIILWQRKHYSSVTH